MNKTPKVLFLAHSTVPVVFKKSAEHYATVLRISLAAISMHSVFTVKNPIQNTLTVCSSKLLKVAKSPLHSIL
jgi:hypothetical protein